MERLRIFARFSPKKGGVENYKAEIEMKAYLKITILCVGANLLKTGLIKIENLKPKIGKFR